MALGNVRYSPTANVKPNRPGWQPAPMVAAAPERPSLGQRLRALARRGR